MTLVMKVFHVGESSSMQNGKQRGDKQPHGNFFL